MQTPEFSRDKEINGTPLIEHVQYILCIDEREKTSKGHLYRENNKTEENPTYFQSSVFVAGPNATHFHFRGFQRLLGVMCTRGREGWED